MRCQRCHLADPALFTPQQPTARSFGFRLPPHVLVPVHGVLLGAMLRLKPSAPFCTYMQRQGTRSLFHAIANK